ncbi:MAG: hypothetical protein NVSMB26_22150 [Beijerinckiaceae bacterium]
MRGLARQRAHRAPDGYPGYGLVLESDGRIVGAILMIYSRVPDGDASVIRCNLSSWYVEPAFRSYASLLTSFKDPAVTYLNVSPAPNTWATVEAQGFRCLRQGWFLSFPALSRTGREARVVALAAATGFLSERDLLEAHAVLGCVGLVVEAAGEAYPFLFARKRVFHRLIPTVQLVYCRDIGDYRRFAGAVGRYLLWRGMPSVLIDAGQSRDALIGRLIGRNSRTYVRGPHPPRSGDLAYTENIFFGS